MFTQRVRNFALPGKAPELRAILEEGVRERHAEGKRSALSTVIAGDAFPSFVTTHWHDDLASFQAFREKNTTDPARQARFQRMVAATRQTGQMELFEVVLANQPGRPPRFGVATTVVPAPGQAPTVRAALVEFVTASQKAGRRINLAVSLSGTSRFLLVGIYESLAELEAARSATTASAEFAALNRSAGLLAKPPSAEIFELLLANPA
jgi:hypothetical protein